MNISWKSRILEVLLSVFVGFLFLSLNAGQSEIVVPRIFLGVLFATAVLFYSRPNNFKMLLISPAIIGGVFMFFQLAKILWAGSQFILSHENYSIFSSSYVEGFLFYLFQSVVFLSVFCFSKEKRFVSNFLKVLISFSLFLSINEIIPLLNNGYGYEVWPQKDAYFHPLIYKFIPLSKYIFSRWCNMNWAGDFIAFGIFSGLGFVFYDLYRAVEKKERVNWAMTTAILFVTAINTAVLFLLKSRGSLVFFAVAFAGFSLITFFKWSFRYKGIFAVFFIVLFSGFVFWVGNFQGALKEVQTLSEEVKPQTEGSWAVNLEGQKRALRMFQTYPFRGVGRGNYDRFSEQFADLGVDNGRKNMANYTSMSHYFQMMAEEGFGSFAYFLFLLFFVLWTLWNILKSGSQFKVLTGVSLLSAILMVLGHASINDLMDRFGMMTLVFVIFGVLAGLFRKDFDHGS